MRPLSSIHGRGLICRAALLLAVGAPSLCAAGVLSDENLISPLPTGFKVGARSSNPALDAYEFVPKTETVQDWSQMVTVQIFHNFKGQDPDQLPLSIKPQWLAACPGSAVNKIRSGSENGYPFSLWQFTCPLNPATQKPENMWSKTIGGADSLYSVQYAYRSELRKEIIPPTMQYLKAVIACDTRLPDKPCPAGM